MFLFNRAVREKWQWSRPLLGKRCWVLHNSRPWTSSAGLLTRSIKVAGCYWAGHTDDIGLYASLIGDELPCNRPCCLCIILWRWTFWTAVTEQIAPVLNGQQMLIVHTELCILCGKHDNWFSCSTGNRNCVSISQLCPRIVHTSYSITIYLVFIAIVWCTLLIVVRDGGAR